MIEPRYKRASATAEELAARFQGNTSTQTRQTQEDTRVSGSPRSALRYRPMGTMYVIPFTDGTEMRVTEHELSDLPEDYQTAAQRITSQGATPKPRRQPNPKVPVQDESVDDMPPVRTHPSGTNAALPRRRRQRFHWLFWVGIAMVIMIAGSILLNMAARWWQMTQDDLHYGRPRTFQIDANVGHGTAANPYSHFIALNLNTHIEVIEIAGDDPSKSHMYVGPTLIGQGEELAPVTLSFEDVNHDGRLDLVIHVGDSKVVFLNQQDRTFKPAPTQ